jgi:hypothetical protein
VIITRAIDASSPLAAFKIAHLGLALPGHKTMAMTGWYVEKATAPLRAGNVAVTLS